MKLGGGVVRLRSIGLELDGCLMFAGACRRKFSNFG